MLSTHEYIIEVEEKKSIVLFAIENSAQARLLTESSSKTVPT